MSELTLTDIINLDQNEDSSDDGSYDLDFLVDWKSKYTLLKQGVDQLCQTINYIYCYECNRADTFLSINNCRLCEKNYCDFCGYYYGVCNKCFQYIENGHHIYLKVSNFTNNDLIITTLNENFDAGLFYNYGVTSTHNLRGDRLLVLINLREGVDEEEDTATIEEIQEDIEMFLNDAGIEIFEDVDGGVEIM